MVGWPTGRTPTLHRCYKARPLLRCSKELKLSPMAQTVAAPFGSEPVDGNGASRSRVGFWTLAIGSIGVVYGDIGTSPLYAMRESLLAAVGPDAPASEEVVLGILSLIVWALILIVTVKYVLILLRTDNKGEGGTLALMALAQRALDAR